MTAPHHHQEILNTRRARMIEGFTSVTGANFLGAGHVAEHLVERGYRKLAYMVGMENSSTSEEREAGFRAGVFASGLPMHAGEFGIYDRPGTFAAARRLLALTLRPGANTCKKIRLYRKPEEV